MQADALIGRSDAFRSVTTLIAKIAMYDAPVLIEGETGTGKELVARALHYRGARNSRPFVPVNCGALPETLIENELFGHRRGAFTDAREDRPGLLALADRGTLFLDEIDALSPRGQVTLLRFLQDHQFRPVGGNREERADVRVVAASNRSLRAQAERGEFRFDLLYRLNLLHVCVPPLRERRGDAAVLAGHFLQLAAARFSKAPKPFERATLEWFDRYTWPGNVRELENLVYREFLLADGPTIDIAAPPGIEPAGANDAAFNHRSAKARAIDDFEADFLRRVLGEANGNVTLAARLCGTERRHLGRLLRKYQVTKS